MDQQNHTDEKHYDRQPPYDQPAATKFPVSSTADSSQFYSSDNSHSHSVGGLHLQSEARVPWSTGLCDCTSDCKNCCTTFWFPSITFGQIAEIVDQGSTSRGVSGALYARNPNACIYSKFYRTKMRRQYMLEESPCGDCLVHCCCEKCALCQEYRELKNRGFDMEIGWHGNVEQRNRGVAMSSPAAPTVEPGMRR